MVDEITDRAWVVIDGADGRAHYAELGRLRPEQFPVRNTIVVLASHALGEGRPSGAPRLQELSPVPLQDQIGYLGPTWLDQAIVARWKPEVGTPGFAAEIEAALTARGRWLVDQRLAEAVHGAVRPQPRMMEALRAAEAERLVQDLAPRLQATFVPTEPGQRVSGRYDWSLCHALGSAGRHPTRGHIHARTMEANAGALARPRCGWNNRADQSHVVPRSWPLAAQPSLTAAIPNGWCLRWPS